MPNVWIVDGQVVYQRNVDLSQVHGLGLMHGNGKTYAAALELSAHTGLSLEDALALLREAQACNGYIVTDGIQYTVVPGERPDRNVPIDIIYPWEHQ